MSLADSVRGRVSRANIVDAFDVGLRSASARVLSSTCRSSSAIAFAPVPDTAW